MPHTDAQPEFTEQLAFAVNEDSNGQILQTASEEIVSQKSIWVTQSNGEQLHLRYFKPVEHNGRRVFMLHGEAESGRVYYDGKNRGLAWSLVDQGYEVFVADLGGRGRSLASPEENFQALSVEEIITQSIPRFLQAIANTPSEFSEDSYYGCPADVWVGHGFGCVLLAAAWARLPESMRAASQMMFFSGRRQILQKRGLGDLLLRGLSHPIMRRLVEKANRFPAARLGLGSADESVGWYLDYTRWITSRRWESDDGFDYAQALAKSPLPPVLHLVARRDKLYSNIDDVRRFIEELGYHNARVLCFDRSADGKNYNHLSMLLSDAAQSEVFVSAIGWLSETGPVGLQKSYLTQPLHELANVGTAEIDQAHSQLAFA